MALTVVWAQCSVTETLKTAHENNGVPLVREHILTKGDVVPDFVSEFTRSALTGAGAFRDLGGAAAVVQAAEDAEFTAPPAPPLYPPGVPPVPDAPGGGVPELIGERATEDPIVESELIAMPKDSDTRAMWEDYAVYGAPDGQRMTVEEASAFGNKAELATAVKQRAAAEPV